jgi:hypothetical protein
MPEYCLQYKLTPKASKELGEELGKEVFEYWCLADYESDALEKCWAELGDDVQIIDIKEIG